MNNEPIKLVLLKVANTCNINCSYCYWFKDLSVYEKSKIIKDEVLNAFYKKLRNHLIASKLTRFTVILHGGEPMLAGKKRTEDILFNLYKIGIELGVKITIEMQTNGILLDNEWIDILKSFNVSIGISIDGPEEVHDLYRRDLRGNPTFYKTIKGIKLLQSRNIKFGILAVCNPEYSATYFCNFFINELGIKSLDFLIPNANYENKNIPQIKDFFVELFNLWYNKYSKEGINIRIAKNIYNVMQGKESSLQSIGYNPVEIFMIKPDGEMEAVDYLHAIGYNFTKSRLNILRNEISDIKNDELWKEVYLGSLNLHEKCKKCKFHFSCGGGHIGSRWSEKNRFDNPSVYCDQLIQIFESICTIISNSKLNNDYTKINDFASS